MKPSQLLLRCYAENKGDYWQAFCLDLTLAAQGDSFEEVKEKLDDMICDYVYDALQGEDSEYADQLLTRKAPLSYWLKFYFYKTIAKSLHLKDGVKQFFNEPLPLTPACHPRNSAKA